MKITRIYAHLDCANLPTSMAWFERFFARPADALPMNGLAEWHHGPAAGFQLYENAADAGRGTITLVVENLADETKRLTDAGLKPEPIQQADYVSLFRLRDPDGNLIVVTQPGRASSSASAIDH